MSKKVPAETENNPSKLFKQRSSSSIFFYYSRNFFLFILFTCVFIFASIQTHTLTQFINEWEKFKNANVNFNNCSSEQRAIATKLRDSVTFLPLKDLRYAKTPLKGHTWFMSSMYDTHEEGEVQYQQFPSEASKGRLLCLLGNDKHDGSWNSYALAWPEALPHNATLLKGLSFISYNHYDYHNIWHGLIAVVPFVGWHRTVGSCRVPNHWVLYHMGEVRTRMSPWLLHLMEATYDGAINIEAFDKIEGPACFEEAVVMRHNEGGMSTQRRMEVFDLLRCKARVSCNVSIEGAKLNENGVPLIGLTMLMRTGPRSFKNDSAMIEIFQGECLKVEGCTFRSAYSDNLSFCDQVRLMSSTDILVSPHGAQITNMFFMDRNSSVMEFYPKGYLEFVGVGKYVYRSLTTWSGMKHRGAWRDPNGDICPYPEKDRPCSTNFKHGKIGHNATFFGEWVRNVLQDVKQSSMEEASNMRNKQRSRSSGCPCDRFINQTCQSCIHVYFWEKNRLR